VHLGLQDQPACVPQRMPLSCAYLLCAVVSADPTFSVVLPTGCQRWPRSVCSAAFPKRGSLPRFSMSLLPRTVEAPQAEIVVSGLAERKVVQKWSLGTPSVHRVEVDALKS
jgi:hypothetical protein